VDGFQTVAAQDFSRYILALLFMTLLFIGEDDAVTFYLL